MSRGTDSTRGGMSAGASYVRESARNRDTLQGKSLGVDAGEVIDDLFSTARSSIRGDGKNDLDDFVQ